jgi:cyclic pyranopterin phosphate synthase
VTLHAEPPADSGSYPPLVDTFGRTATDLRISLTDRCSLRCSYCMPAEGLAWLPRGDILTDGELARLSALFVRLGVHTVRLTGGEPLLRPGLPGIVAMLSALDPAPEIALTTNAIGLSRLAAPLAQAGLARINISLDTLDRETFHQITRRDRLADVLAGISAAQAAGLQPLKINTVLARDVNLAEAPRLLQWSLEHGYQLRFIEHMPLDAQHHWSRDAMVSAEEMLALLERDFRLAPVDQRGSAPAELFHVLDGPQASNWAVRPGTVGIIASVTRPFCRDCDRLRLTADGALRTCLFANDETDLRTPLRDGASDDELAALIRTAVHGKQAGHAINSPLFVQPARPMSAIGG